MNRNKILTLAQKWANQINNNHFYHGHYLAVPGYNGVTIIELGPIFRQFAVKFNEKGKLASFLCTYVPEKYKNDSLTENELKYYRVLWNDLLKLI